MSAIVTSDRGEDWYTNSYTWQTILERAFSRLDERQADEYHAYANTIGADFELMQAQIRPEVAHWLLATIEELLGTAGAEYGWDKPSDQQHLGDLASMLRRMAEGESGASGATDVSA